VNSVPIRAGSRVNTPTKRSIATPIGLGSVLTWIDGGVVGPMGYEFDKGSQVLHWYDRDGWLPIKRSICGLSVKGKSEPATYGNDLALGACGVCLKRAPREEG
jgi:hypothetical protein